MSTSSALTVSNLAEMLDTNPYQFDVLKDSGSNFDHAISVLRELQAKSSRELHYLMSSHYVKPCIVRRTFDAAIRTVETLVLPYAAELSKANYSVVNDVLSGLLRRAELWYGFKDTFFNGWMELSSDPAMIYAATAELRVIAAIDSADIPANVRRQVVSTNNSPRTLMLSLGTPLEGLLEARPEQLDDIISVILRDRTIDGDRIEAVLDADAPSLASGLL